MSVVFETTFVPYHIENIHTIPNMAPVKHKSNNYYTGKSSNKYFLPRLYISVSQINISCRCKIFNLQLKKARISSEWQF